MKVGVAGLGRMGAAVASRLLGKGHDVHVWNRTVAKTRDLAAAGAAVASSPADLASDCQFIISMLTDAGAIDAVYGGKKGMLAGAVTGKLFIDMSTVRPQTAIALADKVRARSASFVECPVGGTVGPAREGRLLGFVGGKDRDVARARQLLDELCRRVEHVGPVGAGARMKLAINLPLMVYWEALGEALALCAPLKMDPARLIDIFTDSSGGANVLKVRGAMIAKALHGDEIKPVTFDVDLIRKDLRTMLEEAAACGLTLPVAQCTLGCFDAAAGEGMGAADGAMVPVRLAQRAREGG